IRPFTIAISHLPLAMTVACSSAGGPGPKPTARNLVLITIDTLRADHVGAYGYARARTTALDKIAGGGADHVAVARHADHRPLPAGPWGTRQRDAGIGNGADTGHRAARERLRDRGIRGGLPARSSVRLEPGLRRLRRPPAARRRRTPRERETGRVCRQRCDCLAHHNLQSTIESTIESAIRNPQSTILPLGPSFRAPRPV